MSTTSVARFTMTGAADLCAPPADLDADDAYTLRWKLHCLELALEGLLTGPHAVARRDLEALQGLVHELIDLAPWSGDGDDPDDPDDLMHGGGPAFTDA